MQNIEGSPIATIILALIVITGIAFFAGIYWNYSPYQNMKQIKKINITGLEKQNLWEHDFGKFIFLEGSEYLPTTQEDLFISLSSSGVVCSIISDLYKYPNQIMALKYLEFDSIVLGTTGVKWKQLDELKLAFIKIGKLPKNIFFAMGEEYFRDIITSEMKIFKIYPSVFGDTPIPIKQFISY